MELLLESDDMGNLSEVRDEMARLIAAQGLGDVLALGSIEVQEVRKAHRGDPATLWTVLAVALGAGGALTVAVSEKGFLTQLARILEKHLESRRIRAVIHETPKTTRIELEGSARRIEKLLRTHWAGEQQRP